MLFLFLIQAPARALHTTLSGILDNRDLGEEFATGRNPPVGVAAAAVGAPRTLPLRTPPSRGIPANTATTKGKRIAEGSTSGTAGFSAGSPHHQRHKLQPRIKAGGPRSGPSRPAPRDITHAGSDGNQNVCTEAVAAKFTVDTSTSKRGTVTGGNSTRKVWVVKSKAPPAPSTESVPVACAVTSEIAVEVPTETTLLVKDSQVGASLGPIVGVDLNRVASLTTTTENDTESLLQLQKSAHRVALYPSLSTGSRWLKGPMESPGLALDRPLPLVDYPMTDTLEEASDAVFASPILPRFSPANVTTRKRLRGDDSKIPSPYFNPEFSLESPRPFKRHLRTIEAPISPAPWDLTTLQAASQNENNLCPFFQHQGTGLSSLAGEPAGSA